MKKFIISLVSDRRTIRPAIIVVPDHVTTEEIYRLIRNRWEIDEDKEFVTICDSSCAEWLDYTDLSPPKVYIAGPMSGLPQLNFPEFNRCAARLRKLGIDCVNPAEMDCELGIKPEDVAKMTTVEYNRLLRDCIRRDVEAIAKDCTHILFLKGWERSKGSQVEWALAQMLGMPILYEEYLTDEMIKDRIINGNHS